MKTFCFHLIDALDFSWYFLLCFSESCTIFSQGGEQEMCNCNRCNYFNNLLCILQVIGGYGSAGFKIAKYWKFGPNKQSGDLPHGMFSMKRAGQCPSLLHSVPAPSALVGLADG